MSFARCGRRGWKQAWCCRLVGLERSQAGVRSSAGRGVDGCGFMGADERWMNVRFIWAWQWAWR
ncbi:hypothetical protein KCP76_06130 [Salmonella enterica subsp. enterica serovar Weltevreden]|nr:hypothetical protein KCP76_06130 [Salmonella enterica subsp. enterica serovar Weltevreden]